ncbi:MAG: MASE3 domain-containing protein [Sulfurimonas sp.]|nr:MASE3 domain-containing protein [Sulfurimonas sp.]
MIKKIKKADPLSLLFPLGMILLLAIVRWFEGYLLFHTVVELFAVIVGILIALVVYYMDSFTRNKFLLFLGIGFFWVAFLDFFHMLSYHGMHLYVDDSSANPSTTLWIFARILGIITILSAPFIRFEKISATTLFALTGIVSLAIYIGTFLDYFPLMYSVDGLTPLKITLEYVVIFFSFLAIGLYYYKRKQFHPLMYRMIQLSLIYSILAESFFTVYADIYGVLNFTGHIFKFLSYWMIFRGVLVTSLKEPFSLMAKASNTYENIPVPVIVSDNNGIIRQVNYAATLCSNRDDSEMIGYSSHDISHPLVDIAVCPICQAIDEGKYANIDVEINAQYKQFTVSPIKMQENIGGTLQICIDRTDRRKAERDLNYEKKSAQNYLDIVNVMILVLDTDNRVTLLNRRGYELIGYSEEEVIGKNWVENFVPLRIQKEIIDTANVWSDSRQITTYYENPILTKDGSERLIAWRNTQLYDVENNYIGLLCSGEDITDIRKTQRELQESKDFYQTMFTSLKEAIIILDENIIIDCNDAALELFEVEKSFFLGLNILAVAHDIVCKAKSFTHYLNLANNGLDTMVECSLRLHVKPEEPKIIELSLSQFALQTEAKVMMVVRDITKQTEEEKLFLMNTRQAQMGEMISMIAHQWRQPLAIINAIVSQMHLKAMIEGIESEYIENLKQIESQSLHLSQTISDYRDFFRPDKPKEYFSAASLVKNVLDLTDYSLKNHSIAIETNITSEVILFTYRNELLQVLIVMLKNALDSFVEKDIKQGKIILSIAEDENNCIVTIHDNAGGIPEAIINKMFTPYFTTKSESHGTGLGLYMSKMIIHEHCEGRISVASQGGETIFTIKIPYYKEK